MGRGRPGVNSVRRAPGQGDGRGGGRGHAGRGGRGKRAAARMLKGRPQPTLPDKLNKELGIEELDDDADLGVNIIGGGPLDVGAGSASDSGSVEDADTGPGDHCSIFDFCRILEMFGETRRNQTPMFK